MRFAAGMNAADICRVPIATALVHLMTPALAPLFPVLSGIET